MDAVEEIKSRLNIEDVIGEYVQLKRAGRNWRGLSPFSSEKTPSFMVSPEKQIWHDFSSSKGGNMFSFVMEVEGLDFKEALELLARKAGVDLEQYRSSGSEARGKNKERLYEALDAAVRFYQVQFRANKAALEYILKKRQFSKATALEWKIGYSPNGGTALIDALRKKGFKDNEIQAAGLSARGYRGLTDMFRGRIMIPLADPQGRIIGFTARILDDNPNAPKYINTPQTVLYDKSRHVFGLNFAKESIRKCKYVVLAEGNLDVITSHQADVKQVVATAGTALTEQHLKALSRFTNDLRLSFDQDNAGLQATERAIPIANKVGVSLSIITIPTGKDPDDLIKQDPELWRKVIDKPTYALDWLMDRYQSILDINSAQGKRQFSDIILAVVRALNDSVEREHYIEKMSELIHVSRDALMTKLQHPETTPRLKRTLAVLPPKPTDKTLIERNKIQDHLLALTLLQPKLRDFLISITPEMLLNDSAIELLNFLKKNADFAGDPVVVLELQPIGDYVKILLLQYEALYQDLDILELRYEAARMHARLIEQYVKNQKHDISAKLQTASDSKTKELLEQAKRLDSLLKQQKEA